MNFTLTREEELEGLQMLSSIFPTQSELQLILESMHPSILAQGLNPIPLPQPEPRQITLSIPCFCSDNNDNNTNRIMRNHDGYSIYECRMCHTSEDNKEA